MRAALRSLVLALLAVALLAITAPTADAQSTIDLNRVAFGGVNGQTVSVRAVGDQLWVGGEFDTAFDPDHTTGYPRQNLAVFDFNTGEVLPIVADTNSEVKAIESDDATTVWISGNFSEVRGEPHSFIVAFDAFTGAIRPEFSVVVDYEINALLYDDGMLYVAGEFGEINGHFFNKLARVDAATGAVDTSFRANPTATVVAIAAYGDRVYAAGQFVTVGKPPNVFDRNWVAGFDAATGLPAGPDFVLAPLAPGENPTKGGVWDIHVSADGNYFYTGDKRNFLTQWDRLTGEKLWSIRAQGDIQAIDSDAEAVYGGTHDGFLARADARLLFAVDPSDGSPDNVWAPTMNRFIGTWDIELAAGALIAVGDFTVVNGESSPYLVVFHSPAWVGAEPLEPPGPPLGDVGCDSIVSLVDALMIAQYVVGNRTIVTACPLTDPAAELFGPTADVNGDSSISLVDSLLIAQCAVGLPNQLCP